jgi:CzcA family heavy metal efflux pump
MLNLLVAFAIRNRGVVIALATVAVVYGLFVVSRSKLDIFPEFAPSQVTVVTDARGFSSEQVEQLVSRPIEISISGSSGLKRLLSQSIQGLSVVTAIFEDNVPVLVARQFVSERMNEVAPSLPQGVRPPILSPLTSATSLVLMAGLTSQKMNLKDLRSFSDYVLTPRLLAVPGVAKVVTYGGEVLQYHIDFNLKRLNAYGISFKEAVDGAKTASGIRGAGFIETANQRLVLKTEGQTVSLNALGEAVIRRSQGMSVRLKDVATIRKGAQPKLGDSEILGKPGVVIQVSDQYGANTLEVTKRLDEALGEFGPIFKQQGINFKPNLFRPASFIDTAIHNLRSSLLIGAIFVVIVLLLFLWNVRISAISLTAVPLSLLLGVIILDLLGISLNTMTLGGLAIALGEVVDDAIIDIENIFRRLKENAKSVKPKSRLDVIFHASLEVRHAVVYATFVVILVFLPIVTMGGVEGKLFAPLGWAYIYSILASLLVALTLTPALAAVLMKGRAVSRGYPRYIDALKRQYQIILSRVFDRPRTVFIVAGVFVLVAACMIPFFGGAFLPEFKEGHFIVHMDMIPGTSLQESLRLGRRVTESLLRIPGIKAVTQITGTAENSDDILGPFQTELRVNFTPAKGENQEDVQAHIRQVISLFPGADFSINTFLAERIEEVVASVTAPVIIEIFGNDLNALDQKAGEVQRIVSAIPGAIDVKVEAQATIPDIQISLNPQKMAGFGFQTTDVLEAIQTAYQGTTVGQVLNGNRVIEIVGKLDPTERNDPELIRQLHLMNADGKWVALADLSEIKEVSGRFMITHENTKRRQVVSCNVAGRDVVSFTNEVKQKIAQLSLPGGMYVVVTGAAAAHARATRDILLKSLVAVVGIILLLWTAFRSGRNLWLVMINLPFALVGGVFAAFFFAGGLLSLGSIVGFVTLFGITTRNSIMLMSHFGHLVQEEQACWGRETAVRGATERLLPILMTASVTGLALLPLAIGSGSAGREIEGPMAMVILGGLFSSTALNLLVMPLLALRYGRFGETS